MMKGELKYLIPWRRHSNVIFFHNFPQHNRQSGDIPMWVGWNSRYDPLEGTMQKLWYLKQMNESSTPTSVVAETLKWSQKVAEECSKYSTLVAYNIAIVKVALQLQAEEELIYGNAFIHFESFHISYTFVFKLGNRLAESEYSKSNPCYRKRISKVIAIR